MNPLSLQGLWWMPDTPDEQETGTLTFDQAAGGRLEVIGNLVALKSGPIEPGEAAVIHGFTTSGKAVTLLMAFVINSKLGFPGIATETWHISTIAVGAHFLSNDEELFERAWIRFDGIARWLEYNPFVETHHFEQRVIELTVRRPQPLELGLIGDTRVYTGANIKADREGDERWTASSEPMIAIAPNKPKSNAWFLDAAFKIRTLAELLYGRPLQLNRLLVELPSEPAAEGYPGYVVVEIYLKLIGGDDVLEVVNGPPMLTAPALIAASPNAIADWFFQYETLNASLRLLFTVASDRRMFLNVRFLLAAQAVETYHRETCPERVMPDEEHNKLMESLLAAIPAGTPKAMREKLKGTLSFSNELNLRQRLRAVIFTARDGRNKVMPAFDKGFIDAVVATRNHETHHGKQPKNLLRGAKLYGTTRRLVILLTVLFLRRLGLQADAIDALITKHQEFNRLWTTTQTH